jgi:hypothetical protein
LVQGSLQGADAGPTPVTLALPGQDFVTGGGHLVVTILQVLCRYGKFKNELWIHDEME